MFRASLLGSAALIAVALPVIISPAHAQDTIESIDVTAQKLSQARNGIHRRRLP